MSTAMPKLATWTTDKGRIGEKGVKEETAGDINQQRETSPCHRDRATTTTMLPSQNHREKMTADSMEKRTIQRDCRGAPCLPPAPISALSDATRSRKEKKQTRQQNGLFYLNRSSFPSAGPLFKWSVIADNRLQSG